MLIDVISLNMVYFRLLIVNCLLIHVACISDQRIARRDLLSYQIAEELPVGTVIADDLLADIGLDTGSSSLISGATRRRTLVTGGFRLVLLDDGQRQHFRLDNEDGRGRLVTSEVIDRDKWCPQQVACNFSVDLGVHQQSGFGFEKFRLSVDILDINDNTPDFGLTAVQLSLPETPSTMTSSNYSTLARLQLPSAIDIDSPMNGLVGYQLLPQNASENFGLHWQENQLTLNVIKPLDREECAKYTLQVVAYDGGSPRRSSSLIVDLTVDDVNDNAPVFERDLYHVTIPEDAEVGRTLIGVRAHDRDLGSAGKVRYRLKTNRLSPWSNLFNVNQETGLVTLTGSLDHEMRSVHNLTLIAEDSYPSLTLTSSTMLVVSVSDVDDVIPSITIKPAYSSQLEDALDSSDMIKVAASSTELAAGKELFVAQITVSDTDSSPENRHTDCQLFQNETANETLFRISAVASGSPTGTTTEYNLFVIPSPLVFVSGQQCDVVIACNDDVRSMVTRRLVVVMDTTQVLSDDDIAEYHLEDRNVTCLSRNCASLPVSNDNDTTDVITAWHSPVEGYNHVISNQMLILASIAAGLTLLSTGVAVFMLCLSAKSENRRVHHRVGQVNRLVWSKFKVNDNTPTQCEEFTKTVSNVETGNTSLDHLNSDDDVKVDLYREGNGIATGDNMLMTLESEPFNYMLRRNRWFELVGENRHNDVSETTSTSCGGCNQLQETTNGAVQGQFGVQDCAPSSFILRDPSIYRSFPLVDRLSMLSSTSSGSFHPPTQPVTLHGPTVTSRTGCYSNVDRGWYSVSFSADEELRRKNHSEFASTLPRFDSHQRCQETAPTSPSQTVRISTMVHSFSSGSRKSVRFADETDMD